jgi:hypothetical protein
LKVCGVFWQYIDPKISNFLLPEVMESIPRQRNSRLLVQHETARSVGKGDHEIIAGYGQAGYVLKWNAGVTENVDFGIHWESLSFGIRGKYSIINGRSGGLSLAGAIGAGSSIGGSHHYGDVMVSYLSGFFESYATGRFVQVSTDPVEFRNAETGQTAFTVSSAQYNYRQVIVGSRFWRRSRRSILVVAFNVRSVRLVVADFRCQLIHRLDPSAHNLKRVA